MPDMQKCERAFHPGASNEVILTWISGTLEHNADLKPRGIAVSNSLHLRGITGEYRGVRIAMDPDLWPEDIVQITFD